MRYSIILLLYSFHIFGKMKEVLKRKGWEHEA